MQLANGSRIAEYTLAAPLGLEGGMATPEGCVEGDFPSSCVAVSGPALSSPDQCSRSQCAFKLALAGADAHVMADFLGSNTVDFTLTCGGNVVLTSKVTFLGEICGD